MTDWSCTTLDSQIDIHGNQIQLSIPGFTYDDIDRNGQVAWWRLIRLDDECHHLINKLLHMKFTLSELSEHMQMLKELITPSLSTSVTAYNVELYPGFYDMNHVYHRLKHLTQLADVGKSSYELLNSCWSEKNKCFLYKSSVHHVIEHKDERHTAHIQEQWNRKSSTPAVSTAKIHQLCQPASTYNMERIVYWSQVNSHGHVTNSWYIQFCYDAIIEANLEMWKRTMGRDESKITKLSCLFLGKSFAGDILTIHVWKSNNQPLLVHAVVDNNQQCVCQCSVQFEGNLTHKL